MKLSREVLPVCQCVVNRISVRCRRRNGSSSQVFVSALGGGDGYVQCVAGKFRKYIHRQGDHLHYKTIQTHGHKSSLPHKQ